MGFSWFGAYTAAAREIARKPERFFVYQLNAVDGGTGVLAHGAVYERDITRGKRKGEPNWRSKKPGTEAMIFVPHDVVDRHRAALAPLSSSSEPPP